jgi:histidinol-phosphate aminotransferase
MSCKHRAIGVEDFIVPWVKKVKPYNTNHLMYAWDHPSVDRLMSNENFHPPSEHVVNSVVEAARKGNLYPQDGMSLREKLAKLDNLKAEQVFIANGSLEVIDVIARIFISPGDEAIIPLPTYPMYELRVTLAGGTVQIISPKKDLTYDVNRVLEHLNRKTRLLFLVNPNNPMGNVLPENDLIRVLDTGIPTVVDEAYYELEDEPRSMSFLLRLYPNLIIVRTMSKAWGIAGFRIGYSLASDRITDYLNRMRITCSISTVNMAAAISALDTIDYFHKQNTETKELRKELGEELDKIEGIHVFPSSGNFMLIDLGALGINAEEVVSYLLQNNIQVRLMNRPELGPGFFRVTIGNREQNKRFLHKFREFLSEK